MSAWRSYFFIGRHDANNREFFFKNALDFFKKSAEDNYAPAIRNLGECYLFGEGVEKDIEKALEYFKHAFMLGDNKAGVQLSIIYFLGEHVEKDLSRSFQYLSDAAKSGDPDALFYMGQYYYSLHDYTSAFPWFQKAAESGNIDAEYSLGISYLFGKGTEVDINKAISYFIQSAEKKHPKACHILATLYLNGWNSIAKDETLGLKYLQKAVTLGVDAAIEQYGELLIEGKLVPKNVESGIKFLTYAADHGSDRAKLCLAELYLNGEETEENPEKVFYWLNTLEDKNDTEIMRMFALMYIDGVGTEKDIEKGIDLLEKCVALGDLSSQELLDQAREMLN